MILKYVFAIVGLSAMDVMLYLLGVPTNFVGVATVVVVNMVVLGRFGFYK